MGAQRPLIARRQLTQLGSLVAFSAVFGCGKRDQAAVLSALITDVVLGMARDMRTESGALHAALRALSRQPSAEHQRSAQAAFTRATLAWKRASTFRAGPFVSSRAFQRAAFWPARPQSIDEVLDSPEPIDEPRVEALAVDARGLYALEYLLFHADHARGMAVSSDQRGARARAYALELGANVRGYADRVQRSLGDGQDYAKQFAGRYQASLDTLVAQALDTLSVALGKFDRIERARRENVPLPAAVEGYFSGLSHQIVLAILTGTRLLYSGGGKGGLSELVAAASQPIDDHVRQSFDAAEQQLRALGMPLETALDEHPKRFHAVAVAIRELRHVLEVEMQSALSG
ncbi:MAG TPA: imelysin family protein [Polyangiaceae bacterium]|nr:imelysin family protein [Polyangiaceae bacterium]